MKCMWFWSRSDDLLEADVCECVVVGMLLQLGC